MGQLNPSVTYQINHQGSVNFAGRCKRAGVTRFIYSSSCSVYGLGSEDLKTEESQVHPQTTYAECKVMVERDVARLADEEFSPTFLRNGTAYGPSPRMRFDLVVNNLAGHAWTTDEIKMTSDGSPWRPLVHVLDICEAMACTLEAPKQVVHNQIFNVGDTEENYQIKQIAEVIKRKFPECQITLGSSGGDNRSYRVSFEKINATLPGFRCERDVETGVEQLKHLFERISMRSEDFHFRGYTRLKQLKYLIETRRLNQNLFWNTPDFVSDKDRND